MKPKKGILKEAMKIPLAVLADAANVSLEGKLNIFGIFNRIWAGSFPAHHPQMQLVLGFEADSSESETEKRLEIQLMDADGKKLGGISGTFKVPKGTAGYPILVNHIHSLSGVTFPKAGDYAFKIHLNGQFVTDVPIHVSTPVASGGKKGKKK